MTRCRMGYAHASEVAARGCDSADLGAHANNDGVLIRISRKLLTGDGDLLWLDRNKAHALRRALEAALMEVPS